MGHFVACYLVNIKHQINLYVANATYNAKKLMLRNNGVFHLTSIYQIILYGTSPARAGLMLKKMTTAYRAYIKLFFVYGTSPARAGLLLKES